MGKVNIFANLIHRSENDIFRYSNIASHTPRSYHCFFLFLSQQFVLVLRERKKY